MSLNTQRLWCQIQTEKKKYAVALVLVVVTAVMWGRVMFPGTGSPTPAVALADASHNPQEINLGVSASAGTHRPVIYVAPVRDLPRDLFALTQERYPHKTSPTSQLLKKSPVTTVDNTGQGQAVHEAAKALKLQTTIVGRHPRAMINGQLVAPGEQIGGFIIREIRDRKVVIEMDGTKVLLEM